MLFVQSQIILSINLIRFRQHTVDDLEGVSLQLLRAIHHQLPSSLEERIYYSVHLLDFADVVQIHAEVGENGKNFFLDGLGGAPGLVEQLLQVELGEQQEIVFRRVEVDFLVNDHEDVVDHLIVLDVSKVVVEEVDDLPPKQAVLADQIVVFVVVQIAPKQFNDRLKHTVVLSNFLAKRIKLFEHQFGFFQKAPLVRVAEEVLQLN